MSNANDAKMNGNDALKQALGGGSGWDFVENNAKLIAALIVVAVLGGLGYVGFQYVQKRQERAASTAFYAVEARYTKLKDGFDRARLQNLMPGMAPKDSPDAKPSTGNLEQDYGTVITDLEKVARDHAGTSAGAQAAILAAETYLAYNQPDKAIEIAQVPAKNMSGKNMLASLSKVMWGSALAAKGDCQTAVGIWQQVVETKQVGFLHPDVNLRTGICYEQMNQLDKAAEMYRKVTSEASESVAGQTAKGLLRAIEMKNKGQALQQQSAKQG